MASQATSPREIAARLRLAGQMLRLQGESLYRAAAYEGGAEAIEGLSESLSTLVEQGRLTEVRGIGPSLAATISDLVRTGHSPTLDRILGALPVGLLEVAPLPGMTLRRLRAMHDTLGISTLEDLRQALAAEALGTVPGIGPQTIGKLREAMANPSASPNDTAAAPRRWLLIDGLDWAARLVEYLRRTPHVSAAEIVGSVRRSVETVGDLNLLAASESPDNVVAAFVSHAAIASVAERGPKGCRARLANGLPVTLSVESPRRFPVALVLATGATRHLERLHERARVRGFALPELEADGETSVYAALDLPFIPPELREDAGELEAAEGGDDFADLVTESDIRGLVHCHSTYSDGRDTIADMTAAAVARGMAYITITDHSPSAFYAKGVTPERIAEQWREIAEAQVRHGIRVFRGTESDIRADGQLDYPDEMLDAFDVVIASIHERHKMDRAAMTARIVTAMRRPQFKIWGHGLGRLLLRRPPVDCDVEQVLDAIGESRAAIEVNGSPYRLDLPVEWLRPARRRGLKFVISTDAHSTAELGNLRHGVAQARRGGLRRGDVLNTAPAEEFARAVRPLQVHAAEGGAGG